MGRALLVRLPDALIAWLLIYEREREEYSMEGPVDIDVVIACSPI